MFCLSSWIKFQVPFRLTKDIVDGMGVTGVEGVFRRCCEETLSVMRTNKEALLTIVEVWFRWQVTFRIEVYCLITTSLYAKISCRFLSMTHCINGLYPLSRLCSVKRYFWVSNASPLITMYCLDSPEENMYCCYLGQLKIWPSLKSSFGF